METRGFLLVTVDDIPTAINNVNINDSFNDKVVGYTTFDGKLISQLQKGMNIIRMSDGTSKKIVVR